MQNTRTHETIRMRVLSTEILLSTVSQWPRFHAGSHYAFL